MASPNNSNSLSCSSQEQEDSLRPAHLTFHHYHPAHPARRTLGPIMQTFETDAVHRTNYILYISSRRIIRRRREREALTLLKLASDSGGSDDGDSNFG